jgi:hypothetical protein
MIGWSNPGQAWIKPQARPSCRSGGLSCYGRAVCTTADRVGGSAGDGNNEVDCVFAALDVRVEVKTNFSERHAGDILDDRTRPAVGWGRSALRENEGSIEWIACVVRRSAQIVYPGRCESAGLRIGHVRLSCQVTRSPPASSTGSGYHQGHVDGERLSIRGYIYLSDMTALSQSSQAS